VAEVDQSKWEIAKQAGATQCIDPTAPDAAKELLKATGGVAAAIDFVGATATFNFGMGALRKAGKLICVGLFGGNATVVPPLIVMRAVSVSGSYVGNLQDLRELLALAGSGKLPAMPLASRPLAEATEALESLRQGKVKGRVILKP
jgi:D-arabinose 1-dehydrogenase-like Zn-dependent alcohol dehydrogenase